MPYRLIETTLGTYMTQVEVRRRIGAKQNNMCCFCGVTLTWNQKPHRPLSTTCATLEHIIPLAAGGADRMENMAVSCNRCNQRRGVTEFELFKRGFVR